MRRPYRNLKMRRRNLARVALGLMWMSGEGLRVFTSPAARKKSLDAGAFASAVVLHALILFLLVLPTPLPPAPPEITEEDFPSLPVEISLLPSAALDRASGLRRLGERPNAAAAPAGAAPSQSQPSIQVARSAPVQLAPPTTVTAPAPTPDLRPLQTPSSITPAAPPLAVARSEPVQLAPPTLVQRPAPPPALRPLQTAPDMRPPIELARPSPLQITRPPTETVVATTQTPPALRPLATLDLPEPAPPLVASRPPPLQITRPLSQAVAAPAAPSTIDLRPLQQPSDLQGAPLPVPVPSQPLRFAAPQTVTRPGSAPSLRPLPSLAAGPAADGGASTAQAGPAPPGPDSGAGPSQVAGGGATPGRPHPGCALEVLILLTPEEKVRCRNEIDAAAARLARQRPKDAPPLRSYAGGPVIDRIPADRRAYYDAVAASREAVRNQIGGGRAAGLSCSLSGLFGGAPGLTSEKIKIPGLPCVFKPPVGAGTEESRISAR